MAMEDFLIILDILDLFSVLKIKLKEVTKIERNEELHLILHVQFPSSFVSSYFD
jgi:hypothetical protein